MTFNSTTYTAPSGSFVATQGFRIGEPYQTDTYRPIYNPAVLDQYTSSFEVKQTFSYLSDEWFSSLSKFQCRVAESDLDSYAEKLVTLTEHSQDCYQTFEKLYSESITQYLVTSPSHAQDGVVWREYQQK
jgi:hypothetical protein